MPQPIKTPAKRPMLAPEDFLRPEGLQHWLIENLKTIMATAGVLVLAGAAWGIVEFVQHRAEEQAAGLYAEAMSAYQTALAPERQLRELSPETKEALERAAAAFQTVRDKHPRTRHAALALFHQANAYASLERVDDAIASYEQWLATYKGHELAPLVIQRLAYALWANGKPEEALARFDEVAKTPDALNRDLAYFEKGRVLEQLGKKDQAIEAYTALAKEFNASPWTSEGNARIVALGGTPPGREPEEQAAGANAEPQPPGPPAEATPPPSSAQPPQ
ncbi:MAG: tetratricopeptide repeat protein [Nitrospirota bacterium]